MLTQKGIVSTFDSMCAKAHKIMVYWPQDRIKEIQKAGDIGPIKVVFGSIHSRMPTIVSIREGDVVFPVTLIKKHLYVCAMLPVEHREEAYYYLVRELGNSCGALTPEGEDDLKYDITLLKPHLEHQKPFNCCSQWAVWGTHGSSIELRPMPDECLSQLRFGYPKNKEKGLQFDQSGGVLSMCLTSTRRMTPETLEIFQSLFAE